MRGRDRELEAGSRAHYEDPTYYAYTYANRIEDVALYVDLARRAGGPVLEYGIGNGRIALPIARHGIDVVGVDLSAAMLADLRARLGREPEAVRRRVRAGRGDMRTKRLGRRFPLVICTFNTALHLFTRQDVERFFARVREHLAPGGSFVVDLSMPPIDELVRKPTRAYVAARMRHPTAGMLVTNRERFDYEAHRQVLFVSMEYEPVGDPAGAWMTPLAHRQFFPQEWEALLHYNGFEVVRVDGDFIGGPLTTASDVMVWHTRLRRERPTRSVAVKKARLGPAGGPKRAR
ncbi:MAG TPA: class I SAM-dependent methyltransferase [Polyangiaceae bacterium]